MTTEQLDAVHKAQPFKPFTLHLADGSKHSVQHPELIWRTQGGRTVFVSQGCERVAILDMRLITKLTKANRSTGRR
jgi:hypothetical protein